MNGMDGTELPAASPYVDAPEVKLADHCGYGDTTQAPQGAPSTAQDLVQVRAGHPGAPGAEPPRPGTLRGGHQGTEEGDLTPYYADEWVTLYHGDCRDVLPRLDVTPDAAVVDPPYGTTSAPWDRWPEGWVDAVGAVLPATASLWCFGTASTFLRHAGEFAGWKFGQEALWVKRNGTGPGSRDRLLVVHEWAYHWYRGRWSDLHHEWEREPSGGIDKSVRRFAAAAGHRRSDRETAYVDDGLRLAKSVRVIEAPSVRYQKRHQDEKPVKVVAELIRECTPPGGLVLDVCAGAGTTGVAARLLGRQAVLVEGDEQLCEDIATRLQEDVLPLEVASC